MLNKRTNKETGKIGEEHACEFLKKAGYKILEKNFRYSRLAEIDIVAKDVDTLVFVEVKTRTTENFGHPFEAVNRNKLMNIFKAGLFYLKNTTETYKRYRIDIISVLGSVSGSKELKVEHLKDISLN